jgi:hypothetical protein
MSKDYSQEIWKQGRIEASIAEAYIHEEVSNFTTIYYNENLPSVHNPPARYNEHENESTLSLFKGPPRLLGIYYGHLVGRGLAEEARGGPRQAFCRCQVYLTIRAATASANMQRHM